MTNAISGQDMPLAGDVNETQKVVTLQIAAIYFNEHVWTCD